MEPDFFEPLEPRLSLLRQEHVLIQAWKKTATYIRYHNWYSDTLELDWTAINLRGFLAEISRRLESPESWENCPLRIVPAPKSQHWEILESNHWGPHEKDYEKSLKLRPLAHVNFQDQVVATALMLGLADRVETEQGDSRKDIKEKENRLRVVSYGNRLFCDAVGEKLYHRWGSKKLYRSYYQDYRSFISRPEMVARSIKNKRRVFIVNLDLSKFYDRVRPDALAKALKRLKRPEDDDDFFAFATQLLYWNWDGKDEQSVTRYADQSGIKGFSKVALPQGLVASGFFSNVVLLPFDRSLSQAIGSEIESGIRIEDVCRYVDGLRVVVSMKGGQRDAEDLKKAVENWLKSKLNATTSGLEINEGKTTISEFGSNKHVLILQSAKMKSIQSAVSGGFDAAHGLEILDKIQALTKQTLRPKSDTDLSPFTPVVDVRDTTVLRFAAGRFRTTYRSLRPLLEESHIQDREMLDGDARAFALELIDRWAMDPSNVRLLRIGLDIWPAPYILKRVLALLKPLAQKEYQGQQKQQVAWYCLSELFRSGATETGMVKDEECLSDNVNLDEYRQILSQEATNIAKTGRREVPWYLLQQALLFLAVHAPEASRNLPLEHYAETSKYRDLLNYLNGDSARLNDSDFATLAVLAWHSFAASHSLSLVQQGMTTTLRKSQVALRSPSLMWKLGKNGGKNYFNGLSERIREDLCVNDEAPPRNFLNLADIVLNEEPQKAVQLRNELSLLRFSNKLIKKLLKRDAQFPIITPSQVCLKLSRDRKCAKVKALRIKQSKSEPDGSQYQPPAWAEEETYWRFHLGFLLRFILTRQPDFTQCDMPHWKETIATYRPAANHWYQRHYGLFNGQPAFGDDWAPITEWFECFLTALLAWPGCKIKSEFRWAQGSPNEVRRKIKGRIRELESKRDAATGTLLMPMRMDRVVEKSKRDRLRICVVQTVIPKGDDLDGNDLTFSAPANRKKHRNHLSSALAAVQSMLNLRATHGGSDGGLDWLIFPELAVHPDDVNTHLLPFARANKTLILAGLTYEELLPDGKLVNSALWIMPECSRDTGCQTRTRRQCKLHLAPEERNLSSKLTNFRPCQWLLEYPWSDGAIKVRLTASICYDATDLALVAQLRNEADIFAIPSLNKDVDTFDRMALALHYHMFQLVIVVNNGAYGGSNAYMSKHHHHSKQVFHLHGQPQASIAFLEIDVEDLIKRGRKQEPKRDSQMEQWKAPPAGWRQS